MHTVHSHGSVYDIGQVCAELCKQGEVMLILQSRGIYAYYFTCLDCIEMRESHFTAQSLHVLFQDTSPEQIFNFLKDINIFGKI